MSSFAKVKYQHHKHVAVKRIAQMPEERHCQILDKKVTVMVIYPDYRNAWDKGRPGDICCSNIIECYGNHVKCRYSGISPLYPDPFVSKN